MTRRDAAVSLLFRLPRICRLAPRSNSQPNNESLCSSRFGARSRKGERRPAKAAELHRSATPIIADVLDGFGKDSAAAEPIGETKTVISDMRNGLRGVSLWQLALILEDSAASMRPNASVRGWRQTRGGLVARWAGDAQLTKR
jgi:hypothetical protein